MLLLILIVLINVQYSQKAVFSFEKGLNFQNYSSSVSLHPVKKKIAPVKFLIPTPLGPSINWALQYLKNETKTFLVLQNILYSL